MGKYLGSDENSFQGNFSSDEQPLKQGGSITVESLQTWYTERTGDVFWRRLFVPDASLQDERQFARVSPEVFGFVRLPFTL